jgi:hypothetical protein
MNAEPNKFRTHLSGHEVPNYPKRGSREENSEQDRLDGRSVRLFHQNPH